MDINELGNAIINGELTYEEAESKLYNGDYTHMNMMDVIAELHKVVSDHAVSVAPVYANHMHETLVKIFELIDKRDAETDRVRDGLYTKLDNIRKLKTYAVNDRIGEEGMLPLYEDSTGSWVSLGDIQFILNGGEV